MKIPVSVQNFLARSGGKFRLYTAEEGLSYDEAVEKLGIPREKILCASLLQHDENYLLAVHPANRQLDTSVLNDKTRYEFAPCKQEEVRRLIPDCEPGALPPFGQPYSLKVIVDKAVDALEDVFFNPGVGQLFLRTGKDDFARLIPGALRGYHISLADELTDIDLHDERAFMKYKVEHLHKLPAMPGIALEILGLRNNPYVHASELATIIEKDPSLTAQLLRYAASPFYAYQGKLKSVEQAIVRVLGLDFVMDVAFGLSLGRSFHHDKDGPLGLENFWRDALYTATLAQALCECIEFIQRPDTGIAYMSGLLHNFGILLLGHLFPEHFDRLNKVIARYPAQALLELEQKTVGVTHIETGMWLMEAWNMPREIIEAVREHHNPDYAGDYAVFANLVCLANRLLKRLGIGDAETTELPAVLLERIGITADQAESALAKVLQNHEGLQFMARKMAA